MKYYLAFDKGFQENGKKKFIIIPNRLLHEGLDKNNNLKALCAFTGRFSTEEDLKSAIVQLIPGFSVYRKYGLVIGWNKRINDVDYIMSNGVIYKEYSEYLEFEKLVRFLLSHVYDPFFKTFLNNYRDHKYLSVELINLCTAISDGQTDWALEQAIRAFLAKALFGKNGLEYAKLYKMVALICSLLEDTFKGLEKTEVSTETSKAAVVERRSQSVLSETQEFEQEWLEHRARLRVLNGGHY